MNYIEGLVNKSFVTEKSKKLIKEYERKCEDLNLKETTKTGHSWNIQRVLNAIGKPIEKVTAEDLSDYFTAMNGKYSEITKNAQKVSMKMFFRRIGKEGIAGTITLLKSRQLRKLPKNLVDRKMLKRMLMACSNSRDRAMIFTFYESGARKSELLNLTVGDLEADEYGFTAIIDGKTGERRIRLIESAPDIRTWLNDHPYKTPDSPLWVSLSPRALGKKLHKESLQQVFDVITARAGLKIHVYPHLMRHSRATELASLGFSETQLNKFFGWEFGSPMPRTYIQRSGVDVDGKLLETMGIKTPDRKTAETMRVLCPSCEKPQSPTASFCYDCGAMLNTEAGQKITKKAEPVGIRKEMEEVRKKLEEQDAILRNLPEYAEFLKEKGEKIKS